MSYKVLHGDCKDKLRELIAEGVQVDSIVTDPPYELGFMGKSWDSTGIAYDTELWGFALQILKPGGHLLSFGGSRTYHRMACAIEDAGFEIRDQIMWIYGQGFPKSLDVSKALDKKAGLERGKVRFKPRIETSGTMSGGSETRPCLTKNRELGFYEVPNTNPVGDLAKQWSGWGTGLKPAHEPIVLARKPLAESTVADNVITHGTGAINIDGCRVEMLDNTTLGRNNKVGSNGWKNSSGGKSNNLLRVDQGLTELGRFPANLIYDGSDEVETEFAKYGDKGSSFRKGNRVSNNNGILPWNRGRESGRVVEGAGYADKGSASRFFYCAKASKNDRQGSKHPTVKPIALMRYLCRLITPPGGTVLDHFAGTGTTGQAAIEEGFQAILIEKEPEYIADINKRMNNTALPLWALNEVTNG